MTFQEEMNTVKQQWKKACGAVAGISSFFLLLALPASAQIRTAFALSLSDKSPIEVALALISWMLGILALIAVVLIIYAGFLWMTSSGNEEKVEQARTILKNAVIGLLIVLSAWALVLYLIGVFSSATGVGEGCDPVTGECSGSTYVYGPGDSSGANFYVTSTSPQPNEPGVFICSAIRASFSQYVDESSATQENWYMQILKGGFPAAAGGENCSANTDCASGACGIGNTCVGDAVAATIEFDPTPTRSIYLRPEADLEKDTTYLVTIEGGNDGVISADLNEDDVDDSIGLSTQYTWTFSTGTEDDNTPPTVTESAFSPFPADGELNVCRETVINFDFSEEMYGPSFNDARALALDVAGTTETPTVPDWSETIGLRNYSFPRANESVQAIPASTLAAFSLYSTRLYGGDAANNFAGAPTDMCGNPLSGDGDTTAEGADVDNYLGSEDSEQPIVWETGENSDCTPVVDSFTPTYDFYGEQEQTPSLSIRGLYLGPYPEIIMEGSYIIAAEGINSCFDTQHLGNLEANQAAGSECLPIDDPDHPQSLSQVVLKTPVGAGDTSITVSVAGRSSEPTQDTLDVQSPYVKFLDPNNGSKGQYVTIGGQNFKSGNDGLPSGTVVMRSSDGTRTSVLAFPEACSDVWSDEEILVIVPETYTTTDGNTGTWESGDVAYIQVQNADGRYSDLQEFTFTDVVRPNLCEIVPQCSNAGGATFTLTGDHFGDARSGDDGVKFAYDSDAGWDGSIASWNDTTITGSTNVNMDQDEYWVTVYDSETGLNSNGRSYEIPCSDAPRVLDIASCNPTQSVYPVPNPRPNTTDACINGNVGILFDQQMDHRTITTDAVSLKQYNTAGDFDDEITPIAVGFSFKPWSVLYNGSTYSGFQLDPNRVQADENHDGIADNGTLSTYLKKNTWYELTISTSVKSASGVAMASPYTMHFRTDDSGTLCNVDSIDVQPTEATKNAYRAQDGSIEFQEYLASPYDQECRLLSAQDETWNWSITNTAIGNFGVGAGTDNEQEVYVTGEDGENVGTTPVIASIPSESEVDPDQADFTVDLAYCTNDDDCTMCDVNGENCACAESVCDLSTNHCTPVVKSFEPVDGAIGTWVTLNGCWFGSQKGNVYWNAGTIAAETEWPDSERCGDTWSNTQIVAEVPAQYDADADGVRETALPKQNYTIRVENQYGNSDDSPSQFTVNDAVHPGLCKISPDNTAGGSSVTAYGKNLGQSEGFASFSTDQNVLAPDDTLDRASASESLTTWSDISIQTTVPTNAVSGDGASDGLIVYEIGGESFTTDGFTAIVSGGDEQCVNAEFCSNPLDLTIACQMDSQCATGCCADSGECRPAEECNICETDADCEGAVIDAETGLNQCEGSTCQNSVCTPVMTDLSPESGPNSSAVTIQGCYFGSYGGNSAVTFDGVNAPLLCSNYWTNTEVIVSVPDKQQLDLGSADVLLTTSDGVNTNTSVFEVTDQCTDVQQPPVLCELSPESGFAATSADAQDGDDVNFDGEKFVQTQTNFFSDGVNGGIPGDAFEYSNENLSSAQVPNAAGSGDAWVEVSSCRSNGLYFGVGCETADDCAEGQQCLDGVCSDIVCDVDFCNAGNEAAVCGSGNGCYTNADGLQCCGARPTFLSSNPEDGEDEVCPNALILLAFSEDMAGLDTITLQPNVQGSDPVPVTIDAAGATVTVQPETLLAFSSDYILTIPSTLTEPSVVSELTGLPLLDGTVQVGFTTKNDYCVPDHVDVLNDETGAADYTFVEPNATTSFTAYMYAENGNLLAPTGEVGWEYTWSPYYDENACQNVAWVDLTEEEDNDGVPDATEDTQTIASGDENNTSESITAVATSTTPDTWTDAISGSSLVSTFYCEPEDVWEYVDDPEHYAVLPTASGFEPMDFVEHSFAQYFRLIYCADNASIPKLNAPVITERVPSEVGNDWFLQYLFTNPDNGDQAFGIRVYENKDRVTPEQWYAAHVPNPGSPQSLTVGGYEAVQDGSSYYVAASNILSDDSSSTSDSLYDNIYLFTFNEEEVTDEIESQILEFIRFNVNVSYQSCDGSDKAKLVRDTKRVNDIGTLQALAATYFEEHDEFPLPKSESFGSYIENITTSAWSSWQGALGNLFGTSLPTDPYNFFFATNTMPPEPWAASENPWLAEDGAVDCSYDPSAGENGKYFDQAGTCWDPVNNYFYCPTNSFTYAWKRTDNDTASVYAQLEYDGSATGTYDYVDDFVGDGKYLDPCSATSNSCACYNYGFEMTTVSGWEHLER